MQPQRTLRGAIVFHGVGVHSGAQVVLRLEPAEAGTGVVFENENFPGDRIVLGQTIPEVAMHATVLKGAYWAISTVEHVLAALWIAGIDNVRVVINQLEVPILDGSAYPFLQKIMRVGGLSQDVPRQYLTPRCTLAFAEQDKFLELVPRSADACANPPALVYDADFCLLGESARTGFSGVLDTKTLGEIIAPARTFGFLSQLPMLRGLGLARGSSLGNTVVFDEGPINEPRAPAEFLHHKILDLVGDLFLLGRRLNVNIRAAKTGHSFNRLVVKHYIENPDLWDLVTAV